MEQHVRTPEAIRNIIAPICKAKAAQFHCDPEEVLDEVTAIVALSACRVSRLQNPDHYFRRSASRASRRLCKRSRRTRQFGDGANSDESATIPDKRVINPLDQLIEAEKWASVNAKKEALDRDTRSAIDRFYGFEESPMQKPDYNRKNHGIHQIRDGVRKEGLL
ncbi:MAG: hypothetical protein WD894_14440 [Pirellulales bacterium]